MSGPEDACYRLVGLSGTAIKRWCGRGTVATEDLAPSLYLVIPENRLKKFVVRSWSALAETLKVAARSYRHQQFVVDLLIDFKFGVVIQIRIHSGHGIVAYGPGTVGEHIVR